MDMIPNDLTNAANAARERLARYTRETAEANLRGNAASIQASMAGAAREAIFADALLQATHAHLEELKTVSKS